MTLTVLIVGETVTNRYHRHILTCSQQQGKLENTRGKLVSIANLPRQLAPTLLCSKKTQLEKSRHVT